LNIKDLREIVDFLEQRGIAEFELDEDGRRIRIIRGQVVGPVAAAATHQPATPPHAPVAPAPAAAPAPASAEPADGILVKSPIVGTFYRSSDPNAAPFVSVGDQVKPGQVLCIIEAMKLMNEIEAEVAGEIAKVFPQNGQPVQFGEPLFALKRA
jgi:acetyl-CoA carboxylase biotin carboxyl carrier protein